jgi:ribosomal protein L40E
MTKTDSNTDTRTLEGARYVLTVKNKDNPLYDKGSFAVGAEVVCLRKSESGYYVPCVAFIVNSMPQSHAGRVTVDLYDDRSERVTVSVKAILWKTPLAPKQTLHEKVCQQCGNRFPTHDDTRLICRACEAARLALPKMKIPAVTILPPFTPGPWFYERAHGYNGFFIARRTPSSASGMNGIASTYGHPDEKEVEANARLIASAPALFGALKGLRRNHHCWCQTWVGGEHEPECAAVIAALALAEGSAEGVA